ncbi:MAG TPA: glycosyltransferase [Solirubrobacteraceae bacterium]|nr:glycosyltransferase [Solirubrobacteraceae bacterium]
MDRDRDHGRAVRGPVDAVPQTRLALSTAVVVPARDAGATLPALRAALAAQDLREPCEVVVVDDAAGAGPGAARNEGVARCSADVLAFTDADCVPEPGWLRAGLAALAAGADVVQGRVVPAEPPGPFDRTVSVPGLTHLYETANLFVRRAWFERAGGFEPWLSPADGKELAEDAWLGARLARAGARVAFAPDAVVRHAVERRGAAAFVRERARLVHFPQIAARIPELRERRFHRRVFLSPRSAAFDLALAGIATRRPLLAAAAALPYARLVAAEARGWGPLAPRVGAAGIAADAVGLGALALGSLRARSVLL